MSDPELKLPESLQQKVIRIGPSVTPQDVDTYGRLQEILDKSAKLQRILDAWERQHSEERKMRRTYAKWMLIALFVQGFIVNVAFFAIGAGYLAVSEWVANSFTISLDTLTRVV